MKAVYKCRLCGEKFNTALTGRSVALKTIAEIIADGHRSSEPVITSLSIHICKNGDYGLSDFLGWRAENEDKAEQLDRVCYCEEEPGGNT